MMGEGPFCSDQVRPGDPYEISRGHEIRLAPTERDAALVKWMGGQVLGSDPDVDSAATDLGVAPNPKTLLAPDVAVGPIEDRPGWATQAPPLAVEYASVGQDEDELREKIGELLEAGTPWIWVVRLLGDRRVEVHAHGKPTTVHHVGEVLLAPGVLRNPVPVEALFDRNAAHEQTLRNLLQRKGFADLDEVLERGREEGIVEGLEKVMERGREEGALESTRALLWEVLEARGAVVSEEARARIAACRETATLKRWLIESATGTSRLGG